MIELVRIDDPLDPRIAAYRDIRERDLVGREGMFVAEGALVLQTLLTGTRGHAAMSVLLAESRVDALRPLLDGVSPGVPIYVAGRAVMDALVGFPIHRGVLAIGRRAPPVEAARLLDGLGERATVVALVGLGNHDNVGGVFRNAAAFGVDAVLLDAGCCDPLYRKAIRVSMGAALRLPFARLEPGEDVADVLERAGFEVLALSPSGAVDITEVEPAPRTAVLLGAEGPGLPPDLLARARTVRIAMSGDVDSLNVATAGGIVLHHLARRAA